VSVPRGAIGGVRSSIERMEEEDDVAALGGTIAYQIQTVMTWQLLGGPGDSVVGDDMGSDIRPVDRGTSEKWIARLVSERGPRKEKEAAYVAAIKGPT
jgi:hypothetical protein